MSRQVSLLHEHKVSILDLLLSLIWSKENPYLFKIRKIIFILLWIKKPIKISSHVSCPFYFLWGRLEDRQHGDTVPLHTDPGLTLKQPGQALGEMRRPGTGAGSALVPEKLVLQGNWQSPAASFWSQIHLNLNQLGLESLLRSLE